MDGGNNNQNIVVKRNIHIERNANVKPGIRIRWEAEHRDKNGRLISRGVSVQAPNPPACLSFRCLYKYFRDALFATLLASYHSRRVAYAEANRHKTILERYRTGEPSPKNIWQAIHANIKLKCPICRRYNVDPFLFDKKA